MLVEERMSKPVLTITPDVAVQDALARMKKDHVRRYPVVDDQSNLVGIVTESDLLNASPSEATTLSVWEVNYLLSKITVDRVMSKKVISVSEKTTVEEAARILADSKVGGLPVLRDGHLVGIITETDIFNIFLEMLGARTPGVRVNFEVKNQPGKLHEISGIINSLGGNIVGLGGIQGSSTDMTALTLKVTGIKKEALEKALRQVAETMCDLREE